MEVWKFTMSLLACSVIQDRDPELWKSRVDVIVLYYVTDSFFLFFVFVLYITYFG